VERWLLPDGDRQHHDVLEMPAGDFLVCAGRRGTTIVISDVDVGPVIGNRFIQPGSYTTRPDGTPGGVAKMVEVRPGDGLVVFEEHILMQGESAWGDDICYRQERMPIYPRRETGPRAGADPGLC
jgi:hypothetical protein